jgi:hypothetical protein
MKSEALLRATEFKRQIIGEFLTECSEAQVDLFNRMYGSVETIAEDKMDWAIQQCERTVAKNRAKAEGAAA